METDLEMPLRIYPKTRGTCNMALAEDKRWINSKERKARAVSTEIRRYFSIYNLLCATVLRPGKE